MENNNESLIEVQLCYARPDWQCLRTLHLPAGSTIQQAIVQSGILHELAGLDLALAKVGIFNKLKTLETVLRPFDRVEIYRPLLIDPKVARRQRVQETRAAHRK